MTVKESIDAALGMATELGETFPYTTSGLVARINQRMAQLYVKANQVDPDYFAICVTGALNNCGDDCVGEGIPSLNLRSIIDPLYPVDRVLDASICDPGTSEYQSGQKATFIHPTDPGAAFPPRITLRDWMIAGVGRDLDGVGSLLVCYSRLPARIPLTALDRELELPLQFHDLIVYDLAATLLRKTAPEKIEMVRGWEDEMMKDYLAHVQVFVSTRESRFAPHGVYP